MNWPLLESYAKGLWAVGGPLVGVLIGAYIANRNQRKHWVADNEMREYEELITTLTNAFNSMLVLEKARSYHQPDFYKQAQTTDEVEHVVLITISNRLFIQKEVAALKVLARWQAL